VSVSPGRQLFLGRSFTGDERSVMTQGLGVLAVPGGHVVVAANGFDGILVRHVDGGWERVGFPAMDPAGMTVTRWTVMSARPGRLAARGVGIARELAATGAFVLLAVAVAGVLARRRSVGTWLAAGLAAGGTVLLGWNIVAVATLTGFATVAGLAGALAVALGVWWVVVVLTGGVRARVAALLAGLAVAATATAMWPLLRWTAGTADAYAPAHRTNLALTAAGIAVVLAAGATLGRREQHRSSTASTPARGAHP